LVFEVGRAVFECCVRIEGRENGAWRRANLGGLVVVRRLAGSAITQKPRRKIVDPATAKKQ